MVFPLQLHFPDTLNFIKYRKHHIEQCFISENVSKVAFPVDFGYGRRNIKVYQLGRTESEMTASFRGLIFAFLPARMSTE